jgi:hypothetical protein
VLVEAVEEVLVVQVRFSFLWVIQEMRREVSGFLRVDLIVVLTQRLAGQCSVSGV